jgi:hypothetical protein
MTPTAVAAIGQLYWRINECSRVFRQPVHNRHLPVRLPIEVDAISRCHRRHYSRWHQRFRSLEELDVVVDDLFESRRLLL